MASHPYRPDLETPPPRIARLPVARGYPVPWFVAWIDGAPEFRMADPAKLRRAVNARLCWTCGDYLGRYLTFLVGPMCGINRVSAEPPSHLECARYSARNCPFLSNPHMVRREDERTSAGEHAGFMIRRNPGVSLLWTTRSYRCVGDGAGGVLFSFGDAEETEWWAEGKPATRLQVDASIRTGLPILEEMARAEGEDALKQLQEMLGRFQPFLPK